MSQYLPALLLLIALVVPAGDHDYHSQISQLPAGTLTGNTYTNDAVGVTYEVPDGWKAFADPAGEVYLDPERSDNSLNRCSKILLRVDAPGAVEGRFGSFGLLFATDPKCFSDPSFPRLLDKKAINRVVDKMFDSFKKTSFASPYGAHVGARGYNGRVLITLTGGMVINAIHGEPRKPGEPVKTLPERKEPLNVKTSFCFTELNGYWIGWAFVADEKSASQLEQVRITFKAIPGSH